MRFKIADRILFCQRCTARGAFRQDVTIYGPTARVMIVNGVVEFPDSELGWAEMRAVVKVGKRKLTAKRLDDKPYHDRQRRELVTMVTDQSTDYYRESWYHPESREDHVKVGQIGFLWV